MTRRPPSRRRPDLRALAIDQWRTRLRAAQAQTRGSFVQPVLTLVTGAATAQGLVFVARPVLTRLFTPEEFGVLTLFTTLTALFAVAGTGRFEDALMLPTRRADAARLLVLALGVAVLSAGVLALGVVPWREGAAQGLGSALLAPSLVLLPASGLGAAWGVVFEAWHSRTGHFRRISAGRVAQSGTTIAVQVGAGLAGAGALGLTAGAAAGYAALALVMALPLVRRDGLLVRVAARARGETRALAHRYRRFPAFSAPAALLNLLSARVLVFGLAMAFGAGPTGHFGLAFGVLAMPVGVVTGAIGQVFFVHAASAQRAGTLGPLSQQVHRRLAALTAYPLAAAALAGPEAFALVFGDEWREAGVYARLLAPWLFLSAVVPPLTRIFDVRERQRSDLAFSVLQATGLTVALVATAWWGGDARAAVAAASAVGTALRAAQDAWLMHLAGVPLGRAALDLVRPLVVLVPFLGAAWAAGAATGSVLVQLAVLGAGGLAYYAVTAWGEQAMEVGSED